MRINKWIVATLCAGSIAMAGGDYTTAGVSGYHNGGFLGVRGSYVFSIQSSILGLPGGGYFDDNYDGNGGSFGAEIGGQEGQWRAILSYDYFDKDNQNYDLFMGEVDYFLLENPGSLQPYLGLNAGWLGYETPNASDTDGLAYGGTLGVVYRVGEKVDLDLSARYLFATQDEVDHIGSVNFAISYFY